MNNFLLCTAMALLVGCAQKKTEPATPEPPPAEQAKTDDDCPPGVKIDCNVPSMTEQEIANINQAKQECVEKCIESRTAEAIGADVIESQCQQGCEEKHFIGQVQVVPTIEEPEDLKKKDSEEK